MGVEDTFNGAKSGLTFMHAYLNTVGQEIGMEQAVSLDAKTCKTLGTMQGMMIKEQAGTEELDTRAAAQILGNLIEESFGIPSEVTEESPSKTVCKVGRCPVYEAAQTVGMNSKDIEATCRAGAINFMDAVTKQLNPNLSYKLIKFRSSADDFCEEAVVLE